MLSLLNEISVPGGAELVSKRRTVPPPEIVTVFTPPLCWPVMLTGTTIDGSGLASRIVLAVEDVELNVIVLVGSTDALIVLIASRRLPGSESVMFVTTNEAGTLRSSRSVSRSRVRWRNRGAIGPRAESLDSNHP